MLKFLLQKKNNCTNCNEKFKTWYKKKSKHHHLGFLVQKNREDPDGSDRRCCPELRIKKWSCGCESLCGQRSMERIEIGSPLKTQIVPAVAFPYSACQRSQ